MYDQFPAQMDVASLGYEIFWNSAEKKGYSGTAVFTKVKPLNVSYGLGLPEHDNEGRMITLEFEKYFFVTVYTPNAKRELERLPYRQIWDELFLDYLQELEKSKPVIVCGDLNVAYQEIDLANPKSNVGNAGFTVEERRGFKNFVEKGKFVDTFRHFYPDITGAYTWWSNFANCRGKNI